MPEPACIECGSNNVVEVAAVREYVQIVEVNSMGNPTVYGQVDETILGHIEGYICDGCGEEISRLTTQDQFSINGPPEEIES